VVEGSMADGWGWFEGQPRYGLEEPWRDYMDAYDAGSERPYYWSAVTQAANQVQLRQPSGELKWRNESWPPLQGHERLSFLYTLMPATTLPLILHSTSTSTTTVHHSYLAAGSPVLAAGIFSFDVVEGKWVWDNVSGHYRPSLASLLTVKRWLEKHGVDTTQHLFRTWRSMQNCTPQGCWTHYDQFTAAELEYVLRLPLWVSNLLPQRLHSFASQILSFCFTPPSYPTIHVQDNSRSIIYKLWLIAELDG
jgi:hypothetical protein